MLRIVFTHYWMKHTYWGCSRIICPREIFHDSNFTRNSCYHQQRTTYIRQRNTWGKFINVMNCVVTLPQPLSLYCCISSHSSHITLVKQKQSFLFLLVLFSKYFNLICFYSAMWPRSVAENQTESCWSSLRNKFCVTVIKVLSLFINK